ncbi:MAG TPA: tetratricopeptide repeat protein [Steroidobacteraceae bacterium]
MFKTFRTHLVLILALACAGPALAQADPTLQQIYGAAQTGHLAQAQQMMNQVLRDHPQSAKAHYVAAELYAREGNFPSARQELSTAQTLEPGLAFARPESVQSLERELANSGTARMLPSYRQQPRDSAQVHSAFPWGWALVLVAAIAVLWALMRRRSATAVYAPNAAPAAGPGYPGAPGYGGYGAPGMGSGIAGGLASGLAVGAGVVAGEELAHHFLDGRGQAPVAPAEADPYSQNPDMGGADFGVSDGGSWDDGGSVGGDVSGGDDWT